MYGPDEEKTDSAAAAEEVEEVRPVPVAPISSGVFQFLFITGCIILFVLISKLYLDQYIEIRKLETKLEQEKIKVTEGEQEIQRLTRELEFLRTDDGTEKIAREKLKMVKPDEVIVVPVGQ